MNKVGIIALTLILVMAVGLSACTTPARSREVIPATSNPQSNSKVAELEAKIRQLEAENQRLLAENRQLSSDLAKIEVLVASTAYTQMLSDLTGVQSNTSDLTAFIHGLPQLPPLPPGLTVSQIDNVINDARYLRDLLGGLPDLPPPGWPPLLPFPQELAELDNMRQTFIDMTEWMENLQDLPEFLATAESLKDLKSRMEAYLAEVEKAASDASAILEEVRDTAGSRD